MTFFLTSTIISLLVEQDQQLTKGTKMLIFKNQNHLAALLAFPKTSLMMFPKAKILSLEVDDELVTADVDFVHFHIKFMFTMERLTNVLRAHDSVNDFMLVREMIADMFDDPFMWSVEDGSITTDYVKRRIQAFVLMFKP